MACCDPPRLRRCSFGGSRGYSFYLRRDGSDNMGGHTQSRVLRLTYRAFNGGRNLLMPMYAAM